MIQKYTIGRNPNNHIVISHPAVSGYHADIVVDDSMGYAQYTFIDHSTNGTMVNGQFLKNASCFVVFNDSIILAGSVSFDWNVLGTVKAFVPGIDSFSNPSYSGGTRKNEISFIDALKQFFNKYIDFSGRATRKEFWFAYLWLLIFSTVLSVFCLPTILSSFGSLYSGDFEDILSPLFLSYGLGWSLYLWIIYDLVFFLPTLSLLVRRIHDTGQDGLWILMLLVPLANIVFFFIWTLSPSDPRPNKWGR